MVLVVHGSSKMYRTDIWNVQTDEAIMHPIGYLSDDIQYQYLTNKKKKEKRVKNDQERCVCMKGTDATDEKQRYTEFRLMLHWMLRGQKLPEGIGF